MLPWTERREQFNSCFHKAMLAYSASGAQVKDTADVGAFLRTVEVDMNSTDRGKETHGVYLSMKQLPFDFSAPSPSSTHYSSDSLHVRINIAPPVTNIASPLVCVAPAGLSSRVICFSHAFDRKKRSERVSALQQVLDHARSLPW